MPPFPRLVLAVVWMALLASTGRAADDRRVLIIGIDGCRPDALEAAATPQLDQLRREGMYFDATDIREPEATDAADTISGPGWSNLLTGVWPDKHNVLDNEFTAPRYDRYPHFFARLKAARPEAKTASFSSWAPIAERITTQADLAENHLPDNKDYAAGDASAAAACVKVLTGGKHQAVVLYQGQVDETGHKHGFHPGVEEYIAAIEAVDANLKPVLQAIEERRSKGEDWLVLVCTDHGGVGTSHGKGHTVPEIRQTFLIVSGPAAAKGRSDAATWQVDVVPTAFRHLGVELDPQWELDGRAVGLAAESAAAAEQ